MGTPHPTHLREECFGREAKGGRSTGSQERAQGWSVTTTDGHIALRQGLCGAVGAKFNTMTE